MLVFHSKTSNTTITTLIKVNGMKNTNGSDTNVSACFLFMGGHRALWASKAHLYISSVLVLFGLVGNFTTMVVMFKSMKIQPSNFYIFHLGYIRLHVSD